MSSDVEIIQFDLNGLTTRITQLENPTKVAFSAFRTPNLDYQVVGEGDLIFDKMELNVGNAFDPTTGVFKAPLAGSYHLTIAAPCLTCLIGLVKNDDFYIYASQAWFGADGLIRQEDHNGEHYWLSNLSYSLTIDLNEGDEIKLKIVGGELLALLFVYGDANGYLPINFSGFLI